VITIHQRYRRTDGQTDRQATCDRNTALCTKVHLHRAVKTVGLMEQENAQAAARVLVADAARFLVPYS